MQTFGGQIKKNNCITHTQSLLKWLWEAFVNATSWLSISAVELHHLTAVGAMTWRTVCFFKYRKTFQNHSKLHHEKIITRDKGEYSPLPILWIFSKTDEYTLHIVWFYYQQWICLTLQIQFHDATVCSHLWTLCWFHNLVYIPLHLNVKHCKNGNKVIWHRH